jgi:hypothetical protein
LELSKLAKVFPTKLSLRDLKHLQLMGCGSVVPFIPMLSQLKVDLLSYYVKFVQEFSLVYRANEEILKLMTLPRRFDMPSSTGIMLSEWAVVTFRASSLLSFSINDDDLTVDLRDRPPFFFPRGMLSFFDFCWAATNLQQLAVFSLSIESEICGGGEGFNRFLVSDHAEYHNSNAES